jgi:hypothetical protein
MVDSLGGEAEFVVPEVVIWEWAEHAAAAFDALRDQYERFPVDSLLIGLPALAEPPTKSEIVKIIERSVPAGVEVWKAPPQTWRDAVEAQVLQTGTGERKEGVKTGAADHLVLACVRETMDERSNAEAVVLATGDKRLRQTCEAEFGDDVLLAGSHHELLKRLVEFEPAADELAEHVEEQLADRVNHSTSDIGRALETFSMGFEVVSRTAPLNPSSRELARLGRVHIFELHDLEVGQFEGGARVGYASVRLFADVHMSVLELGREDDGGLGWVQTYSGTLTDGMIDLTLNLSFDRDWSLLSVTSSGVAVIDFNPSDEDVDQDEDETAV